MPVDSGVFVAGVGVLAGFQAMTLGLVFETYRMAQADDEARDAADAADQQARDAEEQAQYAHTRLTRHLQRDHGRDVREAAEAEREARQTARRAD